MIRVSQLRLVAGDVAARRRTGDGFARRTGLVAAGQAAVKATQVVLSIALVRLLGPADWNATAFLLSIYLAGTTIGTLNMQHGLVFFLPRMHPEQRSSLVLRTMAVLLGMGALIWLALTAAAPALSGGRLSDSSTVIWIGAAIALELPSACVPMAMIATDRFGRAAIWDLAGTVLILVATIVPAASGAGTAGVVAGLVAVGAIRLVAGVWFVDRTLTEDTSTTTTSDGRRPVARHVLARQLVYSIPLGVAVAVAMLNRLVDKWFIAAFRSGDFGTYAVAAQEVPLLAVLPYAGGAAIVTSLVAAFRDDDLALARTHWLHLTVTMSAVVVPMAIGLVLVAPEVMRLLFTDSMVRGVVAFQLFTLVTVHRVAEYGLVLRAAGRTRDLMLVALCTLSANFVLAGFGAWFWGMTGASTGTVIATGIGWMLALHRIADTFAIPVRDAFAWRTWGSWVAISGISAVAAQLVVVPLPLGLVGTLVAKIGVFAAGVGMGLRRWRKSPTSRLPAALVVPERSISEPTRSSTGLVGT